MSSRKQLKTSRRGIISSRPSHCKEWDWVCQLYSRRLKLLKEDGEGYEGDEGIVEVRNGIDLTKAWWRKGFNWIRSFK